MRAKSDDMPETPAASNEAVREVYGPSDLPIGHFEERVGRPGRFPFTRGIHPSMYRGKLWTMRQFSGFGTPGETNRRLKYLLRQGQTGLSVAFDLPTLMGLDSDDPLAEGEVGKCGVAVDSLRDFEELFDGIDLARVTTSKTINAPAAAILAFYVVAAEKRGCRLDEVGGTLQNDILKEYIAQKEWIYPPIPSMRLVVDTIEFCTEHLPRYNPISISGYHIREAGATAIQELAFTLRDGIEYVEACRDRGLRVDDFAPRLSFFFNVHNDFFEEVAKFRAARRLWATIMRDRFGSDRERSRMCRFHTQTAGCSLTARQPYNNVVRTALQALAAVLGGTNSLHTNALDEALSLPTEEAARLALRTQQVIAHESGVADTVDPLGGSWFVEYLTDRVEAGADEYIGRIDKMGGMIAAIEQGFPQKEIQDSAYRYQKAVEDKRQIVVGVNAFTSEHDAGVETLRVGEELRGVQAGRLEETRRSRHDRGVRRALEGLRRAARGEGNLMPFLIDAAREYATLGELSGALKEVFGVYEEPA
jgi:methylmalonyl-CoA mutase, N-terminal domain